MTRTHSRRGATAAVAIAALSLFGCSADDGEPAARTASAIPHSSPTPSPSATAVVVMPDRPAEMEDQSVSGAEAAAAYFFQVDHYAQSTGDTEELKLMSHTTCKPCAERIEQAQRVAAEGYSFTGGEITTRVIVAYKQDPATGIWPVDLEITEGKAMLTGPDGSIAFSTDAATFTKRVEVAFRDGHWLMFTVGSIPEK